MNRAASDAFDCRGGFADRGTTAARSSTAELSPPTRDEVSGRRLVSVFVYGTLMDDAQVLAVVGRPLARRPAVLEGYERVLPAGGYPYVVPRAGGAVEGLLLDDVDSAALAALDAYEDEGRLYLRREAVAVAAGHPVSCQVYVGGGIRAAPARV